MQENIFLREDVWTRLKDILPGKESDPGRTAQDNRLFLEAVIWVAKNGGRWRALPETYGKWNSVFQRFRRWAKKGVWSKVFHIFSLDEEMKWLVLDSIIVRAQKDFEERRLK